MVPLILPPLNTGSGSSRSCQTPNTGQGSLNPCQPPDTEPCLLQTHTPLPSPFHQFTGHGSHKRPPYVPLRSLNWANPPVGQGSSCTVTSPQNLPHRPRLPAHSWWSLEPPITLSSFVLSELSVPWAHHIPGHRHFPCPSPISEPP